VGERTLWRQFPAGGRYLTSAANRARPANPRLRLPARDRVRVNEIFYSLQGESTQVGRPCVFVRLTGCQMRCVWCDSEHSFYQGDWLTIDEVLQQLEAFDCRLVEVTGGEPLLQPGCYTLMKQLCDQGYEVMLETGGGIAIDNVDTRVRRIVDLKCPGSGEVDNNLWSNLRQVTARDEIKFVITDRNDFDWAVEICRRHSLHETCPILISPVEAASTKLNPVQLAEWILETCLPIRMQLQLHKTLWNGARGT